MESRFNIFCPVKKKLKLLRNKTGKTSNEIIAKDGREWLMI